MHANYVSTYMHHTLLSQIIKGNVYLMTFTSLAAYKRRVMPSRAGSQVWSGNESNHQVAVFLIPVWEVGQVQSGNETYQSALTPRADVS